MDGPNLDDLKALAALIAVPDRPEGPGWGTIAELAQMAGISINAAKGRLERAVENGIVEKCVVMNKRYYRLIDDR